MSSFAAQNLSWLITDSGQTNFFYLSLQWTRTLFLLHMNEREFLHVNIEFFLGALGSWEGDPFKPLRMICVD